MNNSVSANLDLLRAIAVCLVLAQHLLRRMQVDHLGWAPVTSLGRFGVLLFFVHTCLVLLRSLQRTEGTGWRLCRHFYIRRVFRIYPLSLLAVFTALALHVDSDVNGIAGLSHAATPGKLTIFSNVVLVQNWVGAKSIVNVLWSLPFEVQMYVFLPLIFFWVVKERRQWVLIGAWVLSVCVAEAYLRLSASGPLSLLRFVPNFLPGVIAFRMRPRAWVKSYAWPVFIAALVLLYTQYPTDEMGWVLCLVLGLGISQFREISTSWVRYLANRMATYSYGIYISHQFAIWFSLGVLAGYSPWLRVPLLVVLLLVIPVLLYHTIEQPAIQLGTVIATRADKTGTQKVETRYLPAVEGESIVATVPN